MRRDEALKHPFTHMETEQPKTAEGLADNGVVQKDDTIDEQMINGPPYKCTGYDLPFSVSDCSRNSHIYRLALQSKKESPLLKPQRLNRPSHLFLCPLLH